MNQPKQIEIPGEHVPLLLNSLLAEQVMGFERRLNPETGRHEWSGKDSQGTEVPWSDTPPFDFAGDAGLAISLAERVCKEGGLVLDLQVDGESMMWSVKLGRLTGPESAEIVGRPGRGRPLSVMICLIIVSTLEHASVQAQHRLLFPAHYLVLQ